MKSMKKILSVILTVALMSAFLVVPVNAAVSQDAQICEDLNVLRGDGSGVTEEYLSKLTNRSQGAKILLRLMGLEDEADSYSGTATFIDAADATAYWQPMLAYLKANPGVGFQGYPDGTFAPNKVMTAQEIYKVLLVSLGYVENVDFTWDQVFTFAAGKGLTALNGVGQITNDHLATALVEALEATKADGQKLVSFLIDEGVVSLVAAQNAGLVPKVLTIMDAFASGSKEITAVLNMPAPTGTTAVLKKGTITWPLVTVEWDSNRQTVKFSRDVNYTPGTYTVYVGENTFDVVVTEEALAGISIGADYIFPLAGQDLQVSLYNQYGEPMTIVNTQIFIFANNGVTLPFTNMGTTIKVDASGSNLDTATSITVNVLNTPTGMNAVKTIALYDAPEIKTLDVAGMVIGNSATRLEENTSGHKLIIDATTQYAGVLYKLTDADITGTNPKVILMSSNEASVPSASFDIDTDGNLKFNALAAGQSTITFLVPLQGIVENYTVTVNAPVSLKTIVVSAGSGMPYVGSWYDLTTFAYDELMAPIGMSGNFDFSKFYAISNNPLVVNPSAFSYNDTTGKLSVMPSGIGTATISYYYNATLMGSFAITVYEAPKASYIQSVDFPRYFEEGASRDMTIDDVVVYSQHGLPFDLEGTSYYIQIERTTGTTMNADTTLSGTTDATFTATTTEGVTNFTLKLMHTSLGEVAGSAYPVATEVIGTEDVTSFAFNNVSTMYAGGVSLPAYYKTLTLTGRYNSQEVVLAGTGAVPEAISTITNSSTNFNLNPTTLVLYSTAAGTTTIKAWIGGNVVAQVNVTSSAAAPTVNTMVFTENPKTISLTGGTYDLKAANLVIKDQYGVNITSSANVSYFSNNTGIVTVTSNGIVTPVSAGTTTISVVENSGAGSAVLTIKVQ